MKAQTKRLLHVDEHREDRARIKASLLEHMPELEIHEACSGLEALQVIQSLQLDCVLLDLKLRDIVGMELVRLIRELQDKPLPIIVWTGLKHDILRQAALSMGIHCHLLKRRDEREVVLAIQRALADGMMAHKSFQA
ncbi:hypothetical protein YTPLAS18_16120 [Nitrospira sp.]|nr:hypothetical protein YTPLAS18_16120 [Nitrospira sp.]